MTLPNAFIASLFIFASFMLAGSAQAEDARSYPGRICTGFRPNSGTWGQVGTIRLRIASGYCSDGYAFMGVRLPGAPDITAERVMVAGDCCPLPEDALLNQQELAAAACPEGFVATGAVTSFALEHPTCTEESTAPECTGGDPLKVNHLLRCSKINEQRYFLGPARAGSYWGWARQVYATFGERITRLRIPVSLRYGIGRMDETAWTIEGCIGSPVGSLLVKKADRRCSGFYYSELLYRGRTGDPPAGTPVKIAPDCSALSSVLEPNPSCLGAPKIR